MPNKLLTPQEFFAKVRACAEKYAAKHNMDAEQIYRVLLYSWGLPTRESRAALKKAKTAGYHEKIKWP